MKGRELKYLIREAGYTQNDVAEFLKISRVHAGRLLSDEIEVDEFYQSKILKFIKKDMFHNVSFDTHLSERYIHRGIGEPGELYDFGKIEALDKRVSALEKKLK